MKGKGSLDRHTIVEIRKLPNKVKTSREVSGLPCSDDSSLDVFTAIFGNFINKAISTVVRLSGLPFPLSWIRTCSVLICQCMAVGPGAVFSYMFRK